jgi:hypothetical protein
MKVLDWVAWASFVTGLIALPFFLVNWFSYVAKRGRARWSHSTSVQYKFPIKSILFFSIPVLTVPFVGSLSRSVGCAEVMRAIHSLTNDVRVSINGKPIGNSEKILSALKSLHWVYAHHSSPSRRINIQICDQSRCLVLSLARDSGDPREYWVFYPKYYITARNEVGRVITPIFDAY